MFIALTCLAMGIFAPTILLPVLREHCELLAEEARLARCVDELEQEVRRRTDLAEAFANDAVINERLAILELHYRRPGEVVLPVLPRSAIRSQPLPVEEPITSTSMKLPDTWPGWAHEAERWAGERGLIKLFLDPTVRPVCFLMSGGLIIAAFVLFAPKTQRRSRRDGNDSATRSDSAVASGPAG